MRRVFLFLVFALQGAALQAQQRDSLSARDVIEQAKRGNWYLRVQNDTATIQGRVTFLHRDTAASLGRHRVRFDDVLRIDRRTRVGSAAGPAAIGVGLVTGGLGMLFAAGLCEGDCDFAAPIGTAAGFAIGGVIGGLLGAAFRPGEIRWYPVWPDSVVYGAAAQLPRPTVAPSGTIVTAQIGMLLYDSEDERTIPLPTFFSIHMSREHDPSSSRRSA